MNLPCHSSLSLEHHKLVLFLLALCPFSRDTSCLRDLFPGLSFALFLCSACGRCSDKCCQWPLRALQEVVKLLPGDAAVVTHSSQPWCPLQGHPPAALPSLLACSLFFSSFCQATDSSAVCMARVFCNSGVVPKVSCSCGGTSKTKWLFLNALLASNLFLLLFGQPCQMDLNVLFVLLHLCCAADSKSAE